MKFIVPLFLFLFSSSLITAQQVDNRIITLGDASMDVAADQVVMTVNLSYSDEKDASLVYELHQLNQKKLAALLKELHVADAAISYAQLITRKERDFVAGGSTQERIKSFQQVTITLNDMKQFAAVQRRLVSDGFSDMGSTFRLSNQKEIENQLLLNAIGRAREKADLMARAISRTVKRVVRLGDAEETESASGRSMMVGVTAGNQLRFTPPLNQTSQTVRLSSQVKLVVELE